MVCGALVLSAFLLVCGTAGVASREKPNFVFVYLDDMEKSALRFMPTVRDRIVDEGLTFERAYVTLSLCCPARATTLTGKYAHNHGVYGNDVPHGGYPKFSQSGYQKRAFPVWLDKAGYETAIVGKYLNNYDTLTKPPGWDYAYLKVGGNPEWRYNDDGKSIEKRPPQEINEVDLLLDKSLSFLDGVGEEPFFLWFGPYAPHQGAHPARRHAKLYPNLKAPRPTSYNERRIDDKPGWLREKDQLDERERNRIDALYRTRARALTTVDEAVGELLRRLEAMGELENTYVVFTSDNGFLHGQHRLTKKQSPYEESISVPLVVRGPDVRKSTSRALVGNHDLAPTFAGLAGAGFDRSHVDGTSFAPLLQRELGWRQRLFVDSPADPIFGMPRYDALRTREYLYVEYETKEKEFYRMGTDPLQLLNRASSMPKDLRENLSGHVEKLKSCAGASCRRAEGF
jgi:N-acetylglucosamine-6-sulfatase